MKRPRNLPNLPKSHPLRVYLDSSDYSELTDPWKQTPERESIRKELLRLKGTGEVEFWFSSVSIVEMAPLDVASAPQAEARADFLVELCGRNALISPNKLVRSELKSVAQSHDEPIEVYSTVGDWFPDFEDVMAPLQQASAALQAIREVSEMAGVGRKGRRKAARLRKHGRLSVAGKRAFSEVARTMDHSKILEMYPMKEEHLRVISAYMLGARSSEAAEAAFRESLRDPRWMTQWFAKHHERMTPIIEWLRRPSRNLQRSIAESAAQCSRLMERRVTDALGSAQTLTKEHWQSHQPALLVSSAVRFLEILGLPFMQDSLTAGLIDARCPGLVTCICAMHDSLRDSIGKTARKPKASDLVDCAHAIYAPYVDIFRADSYMSQHISPLAAKHGTKVVNRLADLPDEIRRRLPS